MAPDRGDPLNANQDYEYRGMIASSWDLLRGDTSEWPDRPFFKSIIADNGEPALDVGCGTGRLLLDFLAAGLDIEGVDVSAEMLELCREKSRELHLEPVLYQQSLEALDLPRTYRTIIIPSSTFQLITDLTDAKRALERCHAHLDIGGRLVMSIMDLAEDTAGDWQLISEAQRPQDDLIVRRWLNSTYDPKAQLEHTKERYQLVKQGEVVATEEYRRSPATRGYTLKQITEMLRTAGFEAIKAVSGFSREPASPGDRVFCMFGTRA